MRVIISGWYGHGNQGDEAILEGILLDLKALCADVQPVVFSGNPDHTRSHHHVESLPHPARSLRLRLLPNSISVVGQADLFLLGGGGFLSDWQHPNVPREWFLEPLLGRMVGTPYAVYAVGAGPLNTRRGKWWTRQGLKFASFVTVRDSISREWAYRSGARKPIEVTADPAFLLEGLQTSKVSSILRKIDDTKAGPVVGISISPFFDNPALWPGLQDYYLHYQDTMKKTLSKMRAELDATFLILPMYPKRDLGFMRDLVSNAAVADATITVPRGIFPRETISLIEKLDLIITQRYHGLIFAALALTPMVGIITHHKSRCILDDLGLPEFGAVMGDGINQPLCRLDQETLLDAVLSALDNKRDIKTLLLERRDTMRRRALVNRAHLANLLDRIASRSSGRHPAPKGLRDTQDTAMEEEAFCHKQTDRSPRRD